MKKKSILKQVLLGLGIAVISGTIIAKNTTDIYTPEERQAIKVYQMKIQTAKNLTPFIELLKLEERIINPIDKKTIRDVINYLEVLHEWENPSFTDKVFTGYFLGVESAIKNIKNIDVDQLGKKALEVYKKSIL